LLPGGGPEGRCVGHVYSVEGAAARQQTECRKPYAAIHGLVLLMMGINARNMSS
jgi:hypothetical protein